MRWRRLLIALGVIVSAVGLAQAQSQHPPEATPKLDGVTKGAPPQHTDDTPKPGDQQNSTPSPPIVEQIVPAKPDHDAERAHQEQEKQQLDIDREAADAGDRTAVATDHLVTVTGTLVGATNRLADYTIYLVLVAGAQVVILVGQFVMFWRQLGAMNVTVRHSETVAKTALLALDRPWLFLTKPKHNQAAWISGDDGLNVTVSLTNYGKAPAIVLSITGAVFPSPGPRGKVADVGPAAAMQESGIIDFPAVDALRRFKEEWSQPPKGSAGSVTFHERWSGKRHDLEMLGTYVGREETAGYIAPFVVGEKETTPRYRMVGRLPLTTVTDGIPVQSAMNIYFMGTMRYHGPDGQIQIVDFCYESPPHGEFRVFRGSPYNHLRTSEDRANNHAG